MLKNKIFWVKVAAILQLLTAFFHSLSLLQKMTPADEKEKQMLDLMIQHQMDMGMGFRPTMMDIMTSFSISFCLLFVLAGLINWHIAKKKLDYGTINSILLINQLVFFICFLAMWFLTFIAPIVCVGLIFAALVIAFFTKGETAQSSFFGFKKMA
jgi:hypothetical protein